MLHLNKFYRPSFFINTNIVTWLTLSFQNYSYKQEFITMMFRGNLSDVMSIITPYIFIKYITIEFNYKSGSYIEMLKTVDGIVNYTLLFHLSLVKNLKSKYLQLNPYDPFVTNNIIEGYQMTLVYNVDDMNIWHMSS